MNCPVCKEKSKVAYTIFDSENNTVVRERRCKVCNHKFHTYEMIFANKLNGCNAFNTLRLEQAARLKAKKGD